MKRGTTSLKNSAQNSVETVLVYALFLSIVMFILYPMLALFYHTLLSAEGPGLDGARAILKANTKLLRNSVRSGILTTLISTAMSLVVGLYSAMARPKIKAFLRIILMVTMISPPFVTSLAYINLFGRRGFFTHDILGLTINPYGMWGVVLMQSLSYVSLHALLLSAAVDRIDPAEINSARDLGASTGRVVRDVVLPHLGSSIAIVALLNFIKSLADFSTPTIIGGSFSTLATESYLNMVAYGNMGKAAVLNILIFLPSLFVYLVYRKYTKQEQSAAAMEASAVFRRKGVFYTLVGIGTFLIVGMLILQYGSIIGEAFIKRRQGVMSLTWDHFREASGHVQGAMIRSIVYSLIAGIVGAAMGILLGYALQIRKLRGSKFMDFLATLPYVLPGTFFGIAYIYGFRSEPIKLTGTAAIVVLNVLFKQLPFTAKVGVDAVGGVDRAVFESIRDLGGNRLNVLCDGVFALTKESFFVSFVNTFSSTMTTVGSILFLVYPGQKVATIVLFDVIQSGKYNVGSAIALWIMAITVTVNLIMYAVLHYGERRNARQRGGKSYV